MLFKKLLTLMLLGFFLTTISVIAQENTSENATDHSMMQDQEMQKNMDKIAADSTMRMQMMDKMVMHTKGDNRGMKQMCKRMMNNPEMMEMMMKMMHNEGMMQNGMMKDGKMKDEMKSDSTKMKNSSDHESHHKK